MQKVYLIYHGKENGEREDCSIFYETPEVYLDKKVAEDRLKEIKKLHKEAIKKGHRDLWTDFTELTLGETQDTKEYIDDDCLPYEEGEEYDDEEEELPLDETAT